LAPAAEDKNLDQFRGVPLKIEHPPGTIGLLRVVCMAKSLNILQNLERLSIDIHSREDFSID
jgi:hypothetical protein